MPLPRACYFRVILKNNLLHATEYQHSMCFGCVVIASFTVHPMQQDYSITACNHILSSPPPAITEVHSAHLALVIDAAVSTCALCAEYTECDQ